MHLKPGQEVIDQATGRRLQIAKSSWWQRFTCWHIRVRLYERTTHGPIPGGDSGVRIGFVCTRCSTVVGQEIVK